MATPESDVERLAELVGWEAHGFQPLVVDWAALEAAVGHPFPADYQRFVAKFPPGDIGILHVLHPLTGSGPLEYLATVAGYHDAMNHRAELHRDFPHRWGNAPGQLRVWGLVQADFLLCWRLGPEPPEKWPVVVCDPAVRDDPIAEYPGSAIQLLLDLAEEPGRVPSMISYVPQALPFQFATYPVF